MDLSLSESQQRLYQAWRLSPSVFSDNEDELILTYKIARAMGRVPSRVLKVLRGYDGMDPELVAEVEAFVESDITLCFHGQPPQRRICLME